MAGILERIGTILSANVNAVLDKCEDPAKMVDQMLLNARQDLAAATEKTAEVMAVEKSAKRAVDDCQADIQRYTKAAQNAIMGGADSDARELIAKKQAAETKLAGLTANYDAAHATAEQLREARDKLVSDIQQLEGRKEVVKAKVATAKAQESVNKVVAGMNTAASISAFERMEAKADAALDKAKAKAELAAGDSHAEDLVAKYTTGAGTSSVDDELARMKAALGQGTQV